MVVPSFFSEQFFTSLHLICWPPWALIEPCNLGAQMPLPPSPFMCPRADHLPRRPTCPIFSLQPAHPALPSLLTTAPSKNPSVILDKSLTSQPHPFHQQTCTLCLQNISRKSIQSLLPALLWPRGPGQYHLQCGLTAPGCLPLYSSLRTQATVVSGRSGPYCVQLPRVSACHSQAGRGWRNPKDQPPVMPPTPPLAISLLCTLLCSATLASLLSSGWSSSQLRAFAPAAPLAHTLSPHVTAWFGPSPPRAFAQLWAPVRPFLSPHLESEPPLQNSRLSLSVCSASRALFTSHVL